MKLAGEVTLEELRSHEASRRVNVSLGSCAMDSHSPTNEFGIFRGVLEAADADRLFLLDCGFVASTHGHTGLVRDIAREELAEPVRERVRGFIDPAPPGSGGSIDLRSSPELALVVVCPDAVAGPWTIIDGNHRAIAHYLVHQDVAEVPVYVCAHSRIDKWSFVPAGARNQE